ncbi:MAG: 30S ribosomal protein S2 [bacterium]
MVNTKEEKAPVKAIVYAPELPTSKEFLKAGVHFGHQTNKWHPGAKSFIYGERNGIHIIDVSKTIESLKIALAEVAKYATYNPVLIVGTKNQAKEIVEEVAKRSGAYYVTHRWVGGLLTNFKVVNKSLERLRKLETDFETGIEGRTKQEIAWMKKEWMRLDRLYGGIKMMTELPKLVIVIDPSFEKSAVSEAKRLGIKTVGLVDTNTDSGLVTYPIYTNDDALSALQMVINLIGDAVEFGNKGNGIKHFYKDYSKFEVKKLVSQAEAESAPKVKKVRVRVAKVAKEVKKVEEVKEVKEEKKEKVVKKAPVKKVATAKKSTKTVKKAK